MGPPMGANGRLAIGIRGDGGRCDTGPGNVELPLTEIERGRTDRPPFSPYLEPGSLEGRPGYQRTIRKNGRLVYGRLVI